jgi:hypothetical protein
LVTLAFATAAAACDLLIDADSLVGGSPDIDAQLPDSAGGEGDVPPGTPPGVPPGGDGGLDGPPVVVRPPPDGSVPSCVAAPPSGSNLLAVTWGPRGAPPACPAGYAPTSTLTAWADFDAGPSTCDAGGCTCAGAAGSPTCDLRLVWSDDGTCNTTKTEDSISTTCARTLPQGATFGAVRGVLNTAGVTCPAATGTPAFDKSPATFGTQVEGCAPAAAPAATCGDGGAVAMPAANEAFACYVTTGACAAGYSLTQTFNSTDTVNDTRACACRCNQNVNPNGCTGGAVSVYSTNNCTGSALATNLGPGCRGQATYGNSVVQTAAPTPAAGAVSCQSGINQTGSATASGATTKLCCVTRCDACKTAATIPSQDGGCVSAYDTCTADPDCLAYRNCVNTTCGGVECGSCIAADAGPQAELQAILSCVTTQCTNACK